MQDGIAENFSTVIAPREALNTALEWVRTADSVAHPQPCATGHGTRNSDQTSKHPVGALPIRNADAMTSSEPAAQMPASEPDPAGLPPQDEWLATRLRAYAGTSVLVTNEDGLPSSSRPGTATDGCFPAESLTTARTLSSARVGNCWKRPASTLTTLLWPWSPGPFLDRGFPTPR
ncbi:hypothetical protein GCM10010425_59640 [Streptomyces spororaveus]|uniref:Pyridoxamine 5'-phosphate oxidase n=1 Tax=Streptomyces spororaveus TaxID=284039 RepID=A0ABQ3T732_9ACTN|nr:hypothetical protein Sspor_17260 [Streptomyces spororaveus]